MRTSSPADIVGPLESALPNHAVSLALPVRQIERRETVLQGSARADDLPDADELIDMLVAAPRQASLADDVDKIFGGRLWD